MKQLTSWQCLLPLLVGVALLTINAVSGDARPNILLILADGLGYGDLGCFGNTTSISTPHLDKLASQGVKLTHNIAAATVCTPSRAAFLTGRYPIRSGMAPVSSHRSFTVTACAGGLPANETTIGEVAKLAGYQTAFVGKWHLGWSVDRLNPHHSHPLNQGFDYFYGIPLSSLSQFRVSSEDSLAHILPPVLDSSSLLFGLFILLCLLNKDFIDDWLAIVVIVMTVTLCVVFYLPLYNISHLDSFIFRNYQLAEQPVHLASLAQKLMSESDQFLQARWIDDAPFLLIVSWLHVNTTMDSVSSVDGLSADAAPSGNAVQQMDWAVGQLMSMLDRYGMANNTVVYFASDHGGPSIQRDGQDRTVGGHNGPFSGGKGEGSTEGSFRVPGIFRWANGFPAGAVVDEPVSLMDVLPTLAHLLRVPLPGTEVNGRHVLDGKSLVPLLKGQETVSPHQFLFHYCQDRVHAIRYRQRPGKTVWKLILREPDPQPMNSNHACDMAFLLDQPKLYNMTSDPTAITPLDLTEHPEVFSIMLEALKNHMFTLMKVQSQLDYRKLKWIPSEQPCCNFPKCSCKDPQLKALEILND